METHLEYWSRPGSLAEMESLSTCWPKSKDNWLISLFKPRTEGGSLLISYNNSHFTNGSKLGVKCQWNYLGNFFVL